MIRLVEFDKQDAVKIIKEAGQPLPVSLDDLLKAYTSPGSVAVSMLVNDIPVACGGILNLGWRRGEAWLLMSPNARSCKKSVVQQAKAFIPLLAGKAGFRRVQATCIEDCKGRFFRLLGFEYEGYMKSFGPHQEDAYLYARIFP